MPFITGTCCLYNAMMCAGTRAVKAEPPGAAVLANGRCDSVLEDIMTLWPGCTPEELYSRRQRRCADLGSMRPCMLRLVPTAPFFGTAASPSAHACSFVYDSQVMRR